jgi:hypothetical protein
VQQNDKALQRSIAPNPNGCADVACTGQCTVTVRCAHRQQAEPMARKWLGAINTPQPLHSLPSKFSKVFIQYKSNNIHSKTQLQDQILSKSQNQLNHLVTCERVFVFICALVAWIGLFFSHSYSQVLCKAKQETPKCVVVLAGS